MTVFAGSDAEASSPPQINNDLSFGGSLRLRLEIEYFRLRVSVSLGDTWDRRGQYGPLTAQLLQIESQLGTRTSDVEWHLSAARLHLQAFYLFEDPSLDGYNDRIMELYQTAHDLITLTLQLDIESAFLKFCPFFCTQMFVCAAFVVLKISNNSFFRAMVDADASARLLESCITALRKMSVANNDIPARLSDVLAFFCTLPRPATVGGYTVEDVRLRQVNTRLSMSVVHDFLRTWRSHFQKRNNETSAPSDVGNIQGEHLPSSLLLNVYSRCSSDLGSVSGDLNGMMGFDFPMDMTGFLDMDMSF